MTTPPAQPRRVLHALDATLITVGAMVGSGIFQTPADIARYEANLETVKRVPYSRERFERKQSMRMALEAGIMTLIILAAVSLLNQWLHFLW